MHLEILHGDAIAPFVSDIARLRIQVFREFPYLYDGDLTYEKQYLATYLRCPDSVAVLVLDVDTVVGASTGLPLIHETPEFQRPFHHASHAIENILYCGESLLLPTHRGLGIYRQFFAIREKHGSQLHLTTSVFCAVERPLTHPLRPKDYIPLDTIWSHFGYRKTELRTSYVWQDTTEASPSEKPMVFWQKSL